MISFRKAATVIGGALSLVAGWAHGVTAQTDPLEADVVDRVVAFVGDSAILQSQIDEEIERLRVIGGRDLPADGPELDALREEILDTWVNLMLILVAADQDSLVQVPDDLIEERVNQEMDNVTRRLGGQAQLQQALAQEGMTLASYRDMARQQIAQQQSREAFLAVRLRDAPRPNLSEEELLDAFEGMRGRLGQRPKLITFRQVIVVPKPTDSAVVAARAQARELRARVVEGEDFGELAREHSDDPGSAAQGGDLGWFRRGRMVEEFEEAAFSLGEGQISDVVESQYGFHVVRVDRIRPAERRASHILLRPHVSSADLAEASDTAESVASQARAGADMSDLFSRYSDPGAPDSLTVPVEELGNLPVGYDVLANAVVGDVWGPITYTTTQAETRYAVVLVTGLREAGAFTFDDVREQIAQQLTQDRQIEAILDGLRARTHIEIIRR